MAFVLLAIIFLFAIVLLFFTSYQSRLTSVYVEYLKNAKAITLLEVISSMPEFRCSSSFNTVSESVCVDEDKAGFFNKTEGKNREIRNKYETLWENAGLTRIEFREVYPNTNAKPYVIYTRQTSSSTIIYSTYASLCSEESGHEIRCKIAKIRATMIVPDKK